MNSWTQSHPSLVAGGLDLTLGFLIAHLLNPTYPTKPFTTSLLIKTYGKTTILLRNNINVRLNFSFLAGSCYSKGVILM